MKSNVYDNKQFYDKYKDMDRSKKGLEGAGEWHVLKDILPSFHGKDVLDLGCGFGWHTRYAKQEGANHVVGIDLSKNMLDKAEEMSVGMGITYIHQLIDEYEYPKAQYDIVLSSLAFHYLPSWSDICKKVHTTLRSGGSFVFSVEHPVFTAEGSEQWSSDNMEYWPVDSYFIERQIETVFLGEKVKKYHRTITTYVMELLKQGFEIVHLEEPKPTDEAVETIEGMKDELRRPMMLIIHARKK